MDASPSSRRGPRTARPPLDEAQLRELALAYVGRFATSAGRLGTYLDRKLRERGWAGDAPPDRAALVERLVALGYIDDAAFAQARTRSLGRRGLGRRRIVQQLAVDGIGEDDRVEALDLADEQAIAAAVRLAERKRLGPFAAPGRAPSDPVARRKAEDRAMGAFLRAGHGLEIARLILALPPDMGKNAQEIAEFLSSR